MSGDHNEHQKSHSYLDRTLEEKREPLFWSVATGWVYADDTPLERVDETAKNRLDREDIIKLAREAGLYVGRNISGVQLVGSSYEPGGLLAHLTIDELERFAALVAAAIRARGQA